MRITVLRGIGHRAGVICKALHSGITACGDEVQSLRSEFYSGGAENDGLAHYGLRGRTREAFIVYKKQKFAVYVDLGYWGRKEGGSYAGYHKIAVNSRHPDKYFRNRDMPSDRFDHFGLPIKPWKKDGKHILVAGMGAKAAPIEGFKPSEWEEAAVKEIKRYTDRPIIYRPKPSWSDPIPIEGTRFSHRNQSLEEVLENCWAVVSHHSNACVDALMEGVPAFCYHGVAKPMGLQELALIEQPLYPDDRQQWCANIAYTQWKVDEIQSGAMWRHLKDEGIIP